MSKKKIVIIVLAVVLVAIAVWYFFIRKPKATTVTETTAAPGTPNNASNSLPLGDFPLQLGSQGERVKQLQAAINRIDDRSNLVLDGVFGDITKDSLEAFVGGKYYPVTADKFDYILKMSNL